MTHKKNALSGNPAAKKDVVILINKKDVLPNASLLFLSTYVVLSTQWGVYHNSKKVSSVFLKFFI